MNELSVMPDNSISFETDQLISMAEQAELRVDSINTIMRAALKMTTHLDWVKIGGIPYLQETGASKVASLMGVSWQIEPPYKEYYEDNSGHYLYRTSGKFRFAGRETEAMGMRSTKDEFFTGKAGNPDKPQKKPQDVDERNVMQAAYTNCLNNGIKRIVPGLRNITIEHLKDAGIDVDKIKGYGFNSGAPTEMKEEAKKYKEEIERMLKEVYGEESWTEALKQITTFKAKDGTVIAGKTDINTLSEKMITINYGKVKTNYDKWVKDGRPNITSETKASNASENQDIPMQ